MSDERSRIEQKGAGKPVILYHRVFEREGFEDAAQALHKLTYDASQHFPGVGRYLYLDIDGHRNPAGGFDHDMFELLQEFLIGHLSRYLTEIHTPLYAAKADPNRTQEDPPTELKIFATKEQAEQVRADLETRGFELRVDVPPRRSG
jgi:hypothetical protein